MTLETIEAKVDKILALLQPSIAPAAPLYASNWLTSPTDGGWVLQAKSPDRATLVPTRNGRKGVRLHTQPGDDNIAGSGQMQRCDLYLSTPGSQAPIVFNEGSEDWWAISVLFPDDFVFPTWHRYALSGFHNTGATGQGNFTLGFVRGIKDTDPGILGFQGYGGVQDNMVFNVPVGPVTKNVWYDFVYHIRWSATGGFFDAWMNGKRKLSYQGPTLYVGQGVYLKAANYHSPLCDPFPSCIGSALDLPSSVVYDRVMMGTTWQSVSLTALEGVT